MRADLEKLAAERGVAERVKFAGYREDVGNIHVALDAFVVASDQEGMSSAMLEAIASGLPVVSTPVSGAHEALLGSPACGIVTDADAASLANAFATLRDDVALRQRLADAAVLTAQRYSSTAMIDAWERLLTST